MGRDRLAEMQKIARANGIMRMKDLEAEYDYPDDGGPSPSDSTEFLSQENWDDVDQFLAVANDLRKKVEELERILSEMKGIHSRILVSPGAEVELTAKLNRTVDCFTTLSKRCKEILQRLTYEADKMTNPGDAMYRIKKTQAVVLSRELKNIWIEFDKEQMKYKDKCKERMQSYLKICGTEMNESQIDDAIENGKMFDTASTFMAEREKKMLFEDVQSRYNDIKRLEQSIAQLHEMFQDVAMLVESQGEVLNNIEANVSTASDFANRAHRNVQQAKEAKHRNIKMKIAACICIIILIFLIITLGAGAFCFYLPFVCR